MSSWWELDTEGHDHYAVCFGEDYGIRPDAIFPTREAADRYVAWRLSLPETDDEWTPRDATVLTVRDLAGMAWNSYDAVPDEGGGREGSNRTLLQEVARLTALLNTPEVIDFAKAVQIEAAHQRERWGSEHDSGKTNEDWYWLLGYLGGKALRDSELEKRLHRVVTVAAAAANWHAALLKTNMRPGIAPPAMEGA